MELVCVNPKGFWERKIGASNLAFSRFSPAPEPADPNNLSTQPFKYQVQNMRINKISTTQKSFITIAGNNYITQLLHREHLYYTKIHTSPSFYILNILFPPNLSYIHTVYLTFPATETVFVFSLFRLMECPIFLQISSQVILGYLPAQSFLQVLHGS